MNKIWTVLVLGGLACGCVSTRYENPQPQPPRQVTDVKVVSADRPPAEIREQVVTAAPACGRATAAVKPLRVLVSLEDGNDAKSPSVCKRTLQTNLEGALAQAGFKVVYAKPAEILVYGTLHGKKLNERGSRVVCQGDVDLEVTRAPEVNSISGQTMRDVIAKRRFDAKSGDARSIDEAQQKLGDRLGPQAAQFAAEGVNKVGGNMKLMELTVVNAWQPQDAAGYPTLFTQKIRNLKGVYSCRVTMTDNATRSLKAEIVYDAEEYPDGFLNRVYTLKELNIAR